MDDLLKQMWGKTGEQTCRIHPLLFHMLDAGNVTQALWMMALPPALKRDLAQSLHLDLDSAGRLFAFWTSLHDLGKAGPAFQRKLSKSEEILSAIGLPFPPLASFTPLPHGLVTSWAIYTEFHTLARSEDELEGLSRVLGGHHGKWPDSEEFTNPARVSNLGAHAWRKARQKLCDVLIQVFDPPAPPTFPPEGLDRNILLTLLSGLVTVSDWLASMQSIFPAAGSKLDWEEYQTYSVQKAKEAVVRQGWTIWNNPADGDPISFQQAFPFLRGPREVQTAVFEKAFDTALPALALIEAPTGIGKTEIAFLLADRWLRNSEGSGLYVAMPTQATSNQMYNRARDFLARCYPGQAVHVQLAHGHAQLSDDFEKTIVSSVGESRQSGVAASAWFLPRKRTLLAQFGIGTVDQVFLSVLQTRHFFVRLFGLYGKVVVFDEIHAYDAYQSELFCRLLRWLHALKVSVILLSATLPAAVREKFITAYSGARSCSFDSSYPHLTLVSGGDVQDCPLPPVASRTVALDQLGYHPAEVVTYLREKLAAGGCAAVICNTVRRAQQVYEAVKQASLAPGQTYLFHARFPFVWRDRTEKTVLDAFGPKGKRPERAVIVATQVIEQSLDLDFDLIVSELAPIDLLIQRAGRLHRHDRADRPEGVAAPCLALMETRRTTEGDPDFGPDSYVYRRFHLLRTQAVLTGRKSLLLPEETPCLVEAVYGDQQRTTEDSTALLLSQSRTEMEKEIAESTKNARRRIVLPPERDDLLTRRSEDLEEEAPTVHADFQALTREAPPGVNLVCLHRLSDGRVSLEDDDPTTVIDITRPPDKEEIKQLLCYTAQVQRPEVVQYFAGEPQHAAWKDFAALRYSYPIVFQDGQAQLEGLPLVIRLDKELGLSFQKEVSCPQHST